MSESRTPMGQAQEEILNTVRKSQAAVVEAIQAWASAVKSLTPSLPDVHVPLADQIPRPQDLVASAYDFAEQLLASQRKFAEDVMKATAPLLPGKDDAPAKKTGTAK
jgi:hypothetical protein